MHAFLELVADHPRPSALLDQIIAVACKRRQHIEEMRINVVFRHAVSPTSHGVVSPSGRRRRPTLFDLKRVEQLAGRLPEAAAGA